MKKFFLPLIMSLLIVVSLNPAQAQTASWYGGKFHGRTTANGNV